jgi:hypothetical protein
LVFKAFREMPVFHEFDQVGRVVRDGVAVVPDREHKRQLRVAFVPNTDFVLGSFDEDEMLKRLQLPRLNIVPIRRRRGSLWFIACLSG